MADINSESWLKVQDFFFGKLDNKSEKLPLSPHILRGRHEYLSGVSGIPKIDYQDVLFNASRSMIRFRKPQYLVKIIDKIINDRIGIVHSAVIIHDSDSKTFILADSKGTIGRRIPAGYVRLDQKNPIISIFRDRKNMHFFTHGVLYFKEIKWILESGQLLNKEVHFHNRLRQALAEMELLDVEICVPCFFKKELIAVIILGKKKSGRNFLREEMGLFAGLAKDAAMALANAKLIDGLKKRISDVEHLYEREHRLFINTAATLARAIDARDVYTHGHTERVSRFCSSIADEMEEFSQEAPDKKFREMLHMTALLHDVGKIGIPDSILNKNGKLTASEREIVERHPKIGASILVPMPELNEVARCVRWHQEWYNGNGYPDGLKSDEIPATSRIVSVADAFDAITSDRPYRKKKGAEEAVNEIKECSDMQFDPLVVKAFLNAYKKGKIGYQRVERDLY